ncbi:hypothetical protein ACHAXH_001535 [Discostella pseudostelligera]
MVPTTPTTNTNPHQHRERPRGYDSGPTMYYSPVKLRRVCYALLAISLVVAASIIAYLNTNISVVQNYGNNASSADDRRRLSGKNIIVLYAPSSSSFRGLFTENNQTTATINREIIDAAATQRRLRHRRRRELSFLEEIQLARTTYKLPRSIEQNFLDWNTEIDHANGHENDNVEGGLPIFWHILKSGGTTIKLMYAQCYHLVEACETGVLIDDTSQQRRLQHQQQQGIVDDSFNNKQRRLIPMSWTPDAPTLLPIPQHHEEGNEYKEEPNEQPQQQQPPLRIVISEDGRKYVNVDVTTPEGIHRASQLGFASSQLADVIFTPLIGESAESLFSNNNDDTTAARSSRKGRMFALFRHPIQRVTSIFYYLQSAMWEPTYNPEYAQWTLHEYANSPYCESNWMVRSLVQKMTGPLVPEDVLIAQEILRRKCLVGFMEEMEESIRRFHSYFHSRYLGMEEDGNEALYCAIEHFAKKGLSGQNSHGHPTLDETSETYEILATKNQLDIRLYEFAKELFVEQGKWMKEKKMLV